MSFFAVWPMKPTMCFSDKSMYISLIECMVTPFIVSSLIFGKHTKYVFPEHLVISSFFVACTSGARGQL